MQDSKYINKFSVAGIDISEFRIVYGSGDEYAASELQAFIEKACGIRLQKLKYRKKSSNEIRVGRVGETRPHRTSRAPTRTSLHPSRADSAE